VTVEDEDQDTDHDDTEGRAELRQQRTRATVGASPVLSVLIGWLIVHSHPPVISTVRRGA
jgi:hypothetical protein